MANLLDKASILLTPTAYDNGSMLSIKPTNGDGDFTFSRNGDGSRVNSSGNIVTEGANLPRINYDNGCGSWLLEDESTNIVTYSEDFSQWAGKINLSIGLNEGVSPSGEGNANLLSIGVDASATRHRLYSLHNFVLGSEYTLSVFAKKDEQDWFQLMYGAAFDTQSYANFDLANGVVGNVGTSTDANIVDYGNGWYRCSITCTATATISTTFEIITTNNTDSGRYPSYQSTANTNVCFLWGAQVEQQSYATSYIPTSGASSTRLRDLASGSGNSTLINSTEGVLYAEISALANSVPTQRLSLSSGNNTNRIYLQFSTTLNRIFVSVVSSSSIVVEMGHTLSNITNFNKIAVKYKQDDFALWINGVEVATDFSGATPLGLSELAFDDGNGGLPFFCKTKALAVFPYLTDAELTALTTI